MGSLCVGEVQELVQLADMGANSSITFESLEGICTTLGDPDRVHMVRNTLVPRALHRLSAAELLHTLLLLLLLLLLVLLGTATNAACRHPPHHPHSFLFAHQVNSMGSGWRVNAALAAEGRVSIEDFCRWWAEETQAAHICAFMKSTFPGATMSERHADRLRCDKSVAAARWLLAPIVSHTVPCARCSLPPPACFAFVCVVGWHVVHFQLQDPQNRGHAPVGHVWPD